MIVSALAEFQAIHPEDLFVYNKLQLSCLLGYTCGPAGVEVPSSGDYIIRPSMNFMGMGRHSRIEYLESDTEHLHPAEFWCEIFTGPHLSIDYHYKKPVLSVIGIKNDSNLSLYKWSRWEKTDKIINFPTILDNLRGNYEWINCEFIGNHLIEVHFRQNPDFRFGNRVAIPEWDQKLDLSDEYTFVEDPDYLRKGFWIK